MALVGAEDGANGREGGGCVLIGARGVGSRNLGIFDGVLMGRGWGRVRGHEMIGALVAGCG